MTIINGIILLAGLTAGGPKASRIDGTYLMAGVDANGEPHLLQLNSDGTIGGSGGSTGTVTSVALTVPGVLFSVSGSPITTSGTLAFSLLTQAANTVFAGPTSGGAATPTMRALVAADIPSLDAGKITTGTLGTARLGSGVADNTKFLRGDSTWQVFTSGTVTSVALTAPSVFSVTGSPVTGSGTLALAFTGGATSQFLRGDGNWSNTLVGPLVVGTTGVTLEGTTTATLRQGAANSATPVAQTHILGESSRGGTDSNVAGANGTIQSGNGTGNSTGSSVLIQTPTAGSTGTTAQTLATRVTINAVNVTIVPPLIVPTINGGTGTTSTLTLQPTTGVGTTGADIIFKVGNNGGTEVARVLNSPSGSAGTTSIEITNSRNNIIGGNDGSGAILWFIKSFATNNEQRLWAYGTQTFYTNQGSLAVTIDTSQRTLFAAPAVVQSYTVAGLPANIQGGLAMVTDATQTSITGLGLAPTGGGSNKVPVFNDGAGWKII